MRRVLMPTRNALLVDKTSLEDAVDAVGEMCQRWAGATYLLVPCTRGVGELPEDYGVLEDAVIDEVWTRDVTDSFVFRATDRRVQPWSVDHFLPSTLYASRYQRDD